MPCTVFVPDVHALAGRRILLIGINYWPEETGVAPYTTALAEHLVAAGSRVTVITGMPHYPRWRVFDGYRGRLRLIETVRGVQVYRNRHYVPARQSAVRRALYEATFLLHVVSLKGLEPPDVVLGIVPSLSGGLLAAAAGRRYHIPFGLVVQDVMGQAAEQSGIRGGALVAQLTREVEGWIARKAAGIAIVAEGFRTYFEGRGVLPERIVHIPNWSHIPSPRVPRAEMRAQLGWPVWVQIVLHAGNMGLKQGLEHVVSAARLAAARRPDLRFVLMGNGSQRAVLESLAAGLPNVTFLDPQPAERFPDVLGAADVLLVNERKSVIDMSLPSKLTAYFVAGRPVVAAVPPGGGTAREVTRSGAGIVVPPEDPAALLAALDAFAADPPLSERLGAAGPAYAADHLSAEIALKRAAKFVEGLLDRPAGEGKRSGWVPSIRKPGLVETQPESSARRRT